MRSCGTSSPLHSHLLCTKKSATMQAHVSKTLQESNLLYDNRWAPHSVRICAYYGPSPIIHDNKKRPRNGPTTLINWSPLPPRLFDMKASILSALALVSSVFALPDNPFTGKTLFAHKFYADEVNAAVKNISDSSLAAKASKVAGIGTFYWM